MKMIKGFCPICNRKVILKSDSYWLRDDYKCQGCGSIPRQRALIDTLKEFRPDWRSLRIHEASPISPTKEYLSDKCPGYTYSYYYDKEVAFNCLPYQNLEDLSFDDEKFDVFITQDVFEHILRPEIAFREIDRVLKRDGIHIFTVPVYNGISTRQRVRIDSDHIEYILPQVYHIDAFGEKSLVTYDWGMDITGIILDNTGAHTIIKSFPRTNDDRMKGLEGAFLDVFVTFKR